MRWWSGSFAGTVSATPASASNSRTPSGRRWPKTLSLAAGRALAAGSRATHDATLRSMARRLSVGNATERGWWNATRPPPDLRPNRTVRRSGDQGGGRGGGVAYLLGVVGVMRMRAGSYSPRPIFASGFCDAFPAVSARGGFKPIHPVRDSRVGSRTQFAASPQPPRILKPRAFVNDGPLTESEPLCYGRPRKFHPRVIEASEERQVDTAHKLPSPGCKPGRVSKSQAR